MNNYSGRNASLIPEFQRRGNDTPSFMFENLNREEDLYDHSYKNQFHNLGVREEVLHETCEKLSQSWDENDVDFYHDEFTWLILQMEKHLPGKETEDALQKLLHISELADEALFESDETYDIVHGSTYNETSSMININDLLNWKQRQVRNSLSFMLQEEAIHERNQELLLMDRMRSMSKGIAHPGHAIPEDKQKLKIDEYKMEQKSRERLKKSRDEKKPDCWHFLRGHCKRGKYCDFGHDSKHGYPNSCKVFLGGLPFHITEAALRQKLLEKGFNVVNKPKVYGGFSPQVCFASAEEAERLIKERTIAIEGVDVDIRPYQSFTKKNQEKLLDVSSRSVFLGGLRKGTTTQMIKKELEALGLKIVNYPLVKAGFSPKVTLATTEQALKLVDMVKVPINKTMVDIRPSLPYTAFGRMA